MFCLVNNHLLKSTWIIRTNILDCNILLEYITVAQAVIRFKNLTIVTYLNYKHLSCTTPMVLHFHLYIQNHLLKNDYYRNRGFFNLSACSSFLIFLIFQILRFDLCINKILDHLLLLIQRLRYYYFNSLNISLLVKIKKY